MSAANRDWEPEEEAHHRMIPRATTATVVPAPTIRWSPPMILMHSEEDFGRGFEFERELLEEEEDEVRTALRERDDGQ
jgi:hypothetical protein